MGIGNRVEIQIKANGLIVIPADIVLPGMFPPFFKSTVMVGVEDLIRESQTETGASQSVGPDLRVLAMAPDLTVVPLIGQISSNFRMTPLEGVGAVPYHLKRLGPLVISGYVSMKTEQKGKKPFKE